jgi:hypothetical protein
VTKEARFQKSIKIGRGHRDNRRILREAIDISRSRAAEYEFIIAKVTKSASRNRCWHGSLFLRGSFEPNRALGHLGKPFLTAARHKIRLKSWSVAFDKMFDQRGPARDRQPSDRDSVFGRVRSDPPAERSSYPQSKTMRTIHQPPKHTITEARANFDDHIEGAIFSRD